MTTFRTIDDLDVAGKRVLVRADLNVPMKGGKVTDTTRIDRTVPTLMELADKGAKVIVLSHLGRPKGKKNPEFTLKPVADALSAACGRPVAFAEDCIGPEAAKVVGLMNSLSPGEREVLDLVVAGRSTKEIAEELGLSVKTVELHRHSVMHKMEARSSVDLVRLTSQWRSHLTAPGRP